MVCSLLAVGHTTHLLIFDSPTFRRNDINRTAEFSAPSPGGVTRLCADDNDKKVRDWLRDQVLALGASKYTVNATGSQFATFPGEDESLPPIAMGSHLDTVATGGRFDGPLGVWLSCPFADNAASMARLTP